MDVPTPPSVAAPGWADWLRQSLQERSDAGLLRRRRTFRLFPDARCEVDGRTLHNFAGNDYLGLACHQRVKEVAQRALAETGAGGRGSPLVCGRTTWQFELEEQLARFEQQAAAIVFPSGMAANLGTLAALISRDDVVFCDRLNHASLVDGCHLSRARLLVYRHDQLDRLDQHLKKLPPARRRWIVTDSIFSMDGDTAPLRDLCDIAERREALVIVDEAHGTGVFGAHGRGVCEELAVEERVAVRIGTLSKALGSLGGFVTGTNDLVDYLWNTARTQVFSTALPPAVCAAARTALEILEAQPELRGQLWENVAHFRRCLAEAGVMTLAGSVGPIVPIVLGDSLATVRCAWQLQDRGFLVGAIRPPTVPRGTSRLRVSVTAEHSRETLSQLAEAIAIETREARGEQ